MNEWDGVQGDGGTRRSGVTDEAIARISQMIERGEIGPGDRLPRESDLAAQLGLSRSSLREAVRALTLVGALEARQGAGTYVTNLSPQRLLRSTSLATHLLPQETMIELFEVRRLLEPRVTAMATARMDDAQLAILAADFDRLRVAAEGGDADALTRADSDFHATIAASVGNAFLLSLHNSLAQGTMRSRMWTARLATGSANLSEVVIAHERIRSAIEARDPTLAAAAAEAHLANAEAWLRAGMSWPQSGKTNLSAVWLAWIDRDLRASETSPPPTGSTPREVAR
ncbi:MAG: FadR/GntR family transcriptional regulator [Candidatus Dormiibacterota bacterium]